MNVRTEFKTHTITRCGFDVELKLSSFLFPTRFPRRTILVVRASIAICFAYSVLGLLLRRLP